MEMKALAAALEQAGIPLEEGILLSAHTTFRIGGAADLWASPATPEALVQTVRACKKAGVPYVILGNGSNVLADDGGFRGCVISTLSMKGLSFADDTVTADAGVLLPRLSCAAKDRGLSGLAFAGGIPGTVGGAVFMNAGAYGGEMAQIVSAVTCYDTEADTVFTLPGAACGFGYRTSVFQKERVGTVILSARLQLTAGDPAKIGADMEAFRESRREKQPLSYPNAGSIFKRGEGVPTAKLIDDAGLKGYTVGGAQISEKHAGFIVNCGGATSADVRALIAYIKEELFSKYGVSIECEIRML